MRRFRTLGAALVAGGMLAGAAGYLHAQPKDGEEIAPEATISAEEQVDLSPKEMRTKSDELIEDMQGMLERLVKVQQVARSSKDVIKLNCVNDKLLQVKQLLNIAESSRNDLLEAIGQNNRAAQQHSYNQITIAHEKVTTLRDEGEACIGEEAVFLGDTEVEVDGPAVVDDPTATDPFPDIEIEDPGYASGYF